jgi:DNA-binding NarL/FixJ family response regulator
VPDQLNQALHRLAEGGTVIDPDGRRVVSQSAAGRQVGPANRPGETQVLRLMAEGRSDRGIAAELFVSLNTVSTHVQRIFHKLDLPDTARENRRVLAVLIFLQQQ